jgi:hypothetical protein
MRQLLERGYRLRRLGALFVGASIRSGEVGLEHVERGGGCGIYLVSRPFFFPILWLKGRRHLSLPNDFNG